MISQFSRRFAAAFCLGLATASISRAQVTVLHPFAGGPGDGANPYTSMTLSGGYLYGTTRSGGDGGGVIFRIDTDGSDYTVLHNFSAGPDGEFPNTLTISGSMIYGTADYAGPSGLGTAFSMDTDGSNYTVLHNFTGGLADGSFPVGSLTLSGSTLYGATETGGTTGTGGYGYGTVFKMNTDGSGYTILRNFDYSSIGESPGSLILSGSKFYGTTYYSSTNEGTVFSMNTDGTGFTALHNFSFGSDGALPGGLTLVGPKLFGVTNQGGGGSSGTIFSVNTDGTGFQVLYTFSGGLSFSSPLTFANGKLYGTTDSGGAAADGVIYRINPDGSNFTILDSFTGGLDGANSGAPLVLSKDGSTLYGTTIAGGANGKGVIFSISTAAFTPATGPIIENATPVGTPRTADFTVTGSVTTGGSADSNTIYSLQFAPGGTLTIHNTLTLTNGDVTAAGGTTNIKGGTLSGPNGLNFNVKGDLTVGSTLLASNVTMTGSGVLTITSSNTYTGGTQVSSGTLVITNSGALGTGPVSLQSGAELRGRGNLVLNNPVNVAPTDSATISATAGATLTLNNLNNASGIVDFGSHGNTGAVLIGPGAAAATNSTVFDVEYGTVGNAGGLNALTSTSNYFGVEQGATLTLNDISTTAANLSIFGSVKLGSKASTTLTLYGSDNEGTISGAGRVVITGCALYAGPNTYTGGTTIAANAHLDVGGQYNKGSLVGNVTLDDPTALLTFDHSNAYTFAGVISGSGSVGVGSGGTLTLTGHNTYSGGTQVSYGVLAVANSSAAGTGPITLEDYTGLRGLGNVTLANTINFASTAYSPWATPAILSTTGVMTLELLDCTNAHAIDFAGDIAAATMTVPGANVPGTIVVDAVSDVTSGTAVEVTGGTLRNGGGLGALTANAGSTTITSGAALSLNDISMTVNRLGGGGSVYLGTKSATTLTLLGNTEFDGVISGAGKVEVTGAVQFTRANTYSGGTTVSQGTLVVANKSGSATGTGPVTINNGGTIGGSGTVSGAMTLNSGGFIEPGVNSSGVAGTKFHGSSLLWNGGGALEFQIGTTSDELLLTGTLTKGAAGAFDLAIFDVGISPGTYTLMTFASTTFAPADFTLQFPDSLPLGDNASLSESNHSLVLNITHSQLPVRLDSPASSEMADNPANSFTAFTPAPEPASAMLLAMGSCALLGWRRRRGGETA
jgi:uncharacterized repeat protein (TIGR03803 family)/autotransporter-associated beta strand protein